MIDEVHMLTGHAFNAMLKTLEEPPEYLKFVLATTDPQKVPVTVLSRCLQFNLRPMAPETVLEHLTQRAADRKRAGRAAGAAPARARRARLDARCAVADRPGHRLRQRRTAGRSQRAPDAGQRRPRPCVPPDRGAGAGRRQDGGRDLRGAAPRRPVGRVHAGRNDRRAAAHGRAAGRACRARSRRCDRSRCGRDRAPGRVDARRRNAAALQPVPARPRRAGPGARRVRGADHGAAAPAGLQAHRRGRRGKKNSE